MENLGLYITSQIFALFALVCVTIGYQQKHKTKVMLFIASANVFMIVSWAFLQVWLMVAIVTLVVVRLLLFDFLERRYKKVHWLFLVLFLVLNWVMCWLTYQNLYDIIMIVSVPIIVYAFWQKNVVVLKILVLIGSILLIIYSAVNSNYTAIAIDAFGIISVVVSYIRHITEKRKGEKYENN